MFLSVARITYLSSLTKFNREYFPGEIAVRKLRWILVAALLTGFSGCRSLIMDKADSPRRRAAKVVGRVAIALPTRGLTEIYYATR